MATYTITDYTSIPAPPTASVYAEMRYGSNGSDGGAPELLIGNNAGDATTGRITWDDTDDAFDTGQVPFSVTIPPTGGASNPDSLSVQGAVTNPIYYSLTTYAYMSQIQVIVGVQINASSAITDLVIQFYKGGSLVETFNLESGPTVDTTSAPGPVAAEVLIVKPANLDNDQVSIAANVQMQAPEGTYPGTDDIFAQVFIQTHTHLGHGGIPTNPNPQ